MVICNSLSYIIVRKTSIQKSILFFAFLAFQHIESHRCHLFQALPVHEPCTGKVGYKVSLGLGILLRLISSVS